MARVKKERLFSEAFQLLHQKRNRKSICLCFGISRGVTGFDREFNVPVCDAEVNVLPKKHSNLSANKTARGILSPIQAKDLQNVYAFA
jgi:hypothetical protein